MLKKRLTTRGGFTLTELAITVMLGTIVTLVIGAALVGSERGWQVTYNRAYSNVVTDSYVARRMFDAVMRKASGEKLLLGEEGNWIEVYYRSDYDLPAVDRYVRFYESGGVLNIEYGVLNPKETLSTRTVCGNVSDCVFRQAGRSAQMILTLDNGEQTATVVSSAVAHNQ